MNYFSFIMQTIEHLNYNTAVVNRKRKMPNKKYVVQFTISYWSLLSRYRKTNSFASKTVVDGDLWK